MFGPLSCYVDYNHTMDCIWKERSNNSHITLKVYRLKPIPKNSCTFTRRSVLPTEEEECVHSYTCTMEFRMFIKSYNFILVLESNSQANTSYTCTIKAFVPAQNIQLKAPQQLTAIVNSTSRKVSITWQNDAVPFLNNNLEHELEYWSRKTTEVKSDRNDFRQLVIEETELEPDTNYTARVRSKPSESGKYGGSWSKWSPEIEWKTTPALDSPSKELFVVLAPLLLAVIIFAFLYFRIHACVVNKVWIHVPNPATFFQPLYSEHNGNFKEWIHNVQPIFQYPGGSPAKGMKRPLEGEADIVIVNPRVEVVSNISYLKPIPINHLSPLNPDSTKQNFDSDAIYGKRNWHTESCKRFYSTSMLEYCNSISGLSGNLSIVSAEGQHRTESWLLFEDLANATLSMMPQDPDSGYSYSDEYCTLSQSDTNHGLVPAKIGLRLNAANQCQTEEREMSMGSNGIEVDDSLCLSSNNTEAAAYTETPGAL
ncbi:interleukin-21 receptor-like isoform X2 [Scyliorhinus torazame]|uniref:interleukin-21 receptor-like isoform X2 n=1 Tax=Scyliorhinus torazame TaxID=75743 RepID=UPI003B5BFA1C